MANISKSTVHGAVKGLPTNAQAFVYDGSFDPTRPFRALIAYLQTEGRTSSDFGWQVDELVNRFPAMATARDRQGRTIWHHCLRKRRNFYHGQAIIDLMRWDKNDIDTPDTAGQTPLQIAVENRDANLTITLLMAGANLLTLTADGMLVIRDYLTDWDLTPSAKLPVFKYLTDKDGIDFKGWLESYFTKLQKKNHHIFTPPEGLTELCLELIRRGDNADGLRTLVKDARTNDGFRKVLAQVESLLLKTQNKTEHSPRRVSGV